MLYLSYIWRILGPGKERRKKPGLACIYQFRYKLIKKNYTKLLEVALSTEYILNFLLYIKKK